MGTRVLFSEPGNAFTKIDSVLNGGTVTGGGYDYLAKNFLPSGDFEGTSSSWLFWKDHAEVESSSNEYEITYEEAQSGNSSMLVTINDSTEAFVINMGPLTSQLGEIQGKTLTYEIWVKNASAADFSFYIDADNGEGTTYMTGDALPTFAANSTWTKYTFSRMYSFDADAEYFAIGIKKNAGTGSILIDNMSVKALTKTEFINNTSFESVTTGWLRYNSSHALDANGDIVMTRVNTQAQSGTWSLQVNFGNSGGYGVFFDAYAATNNLQSINGGKYRASIWVKTALSGYVFEVYMDGDYELAGYTGPKAITADNQWHEYIIEGTYTITSGTNVLVGVRQTTGVQGLVYMDNASFSMPDELTETPVSTYLTLSPAMTYNPADNLVGKHLVFRTGDNQNFGSLITDLTHVSNAISRIELADALPVVPASGDKFVVMLPSSGRYAFGGSSRIVLSAQDYLTDDVSISTSIDVGYSKASMTFSRDVLSTRLFQRNILGWMVQIDSDYGMVFEGTVSAYSVTTDGINVELIGFYDKLNEVRYAAYFDTNSSNTVPTIVKDILSAQPEIEYSDTTIDRGDALHTVQVSAGGVGPMDFTDGTVTAKEALDRVLRVGSFGEDTLDTMVVQFWTNRTAWMARIENNPSVDDAHWFVYQSNTLNSRVGVSIGLDRLDRANVYHGTYSGEGGEQLETAGIYDLDDAVKYGIVEKQAATNSLTEGEVYFALEVQANDKRQESSVTDLTVSGFVAKRGFGMPMPAYMIKAGDIIFIADAVKYDSGMIGGDNKTQVIVAGEVTVNLKELTARITPYRRADKIENLVSQLEVNIG